MTTIYKIVDPLTWVPVYVGSTKDWGRLKSRKLDGHKNQLVREHADRLKRAGWSFVFVKLAYIEDRKANGLMQEIITELRTAYELYNAIAPTAR